MRSAHSATEEQEEQAPAEVLAKGEYGAPEGQFVQAPADMYRPLKQLVQTPEFITHWWQPVPPTLPTALHGVQAAAPVALYDSALA